ncbi:hypothetical protein QBC44DRAFT_123823 [Cladorrhinum sp. PSN332]|nr:hypothetical protein QBC44DRAFT_123823 [Cladorrhinum sp. PSN332]
MRHSFCFSHHPHMDIPKHHLSSCSPLRWQVPLLRGQFQNAQTIPRLPRSRRVLAIFRCPYGNSVTLLWLLHGRSFDKRMAGDDRKSQHPKPVPRTQQQTTTSDAHADRSGRQERVEVGLASGFERRRAENDAQTVPSLGIPSEEETLLGWGRPTRPQLKWQMVSGHNPPAPPSATLYVSRHGFAIYTDVTDRLTDPQDSTHIPPTCLDRV